MTSSSAVQEGVSEASRNPQPGVIKEDGNPDSAPIQAEPDTGAGRDGEHLAPPAGWLLPTVLAP